MDGLGAAPGAGGQETEAGSEAPFPVERGERARPLFREEVLQFRARRLDGEVVALHVFRHWLLIGLFVAIVAALIAWAALARYSQLAVIRGVVLPETPVVKVYPARAGMFRSLKVSEGQLVEKGTVIAEIATDIDASAPQSTNREISALTERNESVAREQLAFEAEKSALERGELRANIAALEEQEARLRSQIGFQAEIVQSARARVESMKPVLDKGYVSRTEFELRRSDALRSEKEFEELRTRLATAHADLVKARVALAGAPTSERQRQATLTSSLLNARTNRLQAAAAQSYFLRAPVTGRVTTINVAPGERAAASTPALTIVPLGGRMVFRAFAPSRAIGLIKPGQSAQVRLDAFPYRRFGALGGRVEWVSKSVVLPGEPSEPVALREPAYRIVLGVDRGWFKTEGGPVPIQTGMTGEAAVVVERRSLLSWLLPS